MAELKIIQITPVSFPTWVRWAPTKADKPKTDKPHYEQVALWALVEHPDGSTNVYGMTADDGGEMGMDFCETTVNFAGYSHFSEWQIK